MLQDFKTFLTKTNALALAIGVIIGGATGKLVTSLVDDLLMPPIAVILPKGDWREAQFVLSSGTDPQGKVTVNAIKYGHLLGSAVDFTSICLVVFLITRSILPKEAPAPATKTCAECLESIPEKAKRCKACGTTIAITD